MRSIADRIDNFTLYAASASIIVVVVFSTNMAVTLLWFVMIVNVNEDDGNTKLHGACRCINNPHTRLRRTWRIHE